MPLLLLVLLLPVCWSLWYRWSWSSGGHREADGAALDGDVQCRADGVVRDRLSGRRCPNGGMGTERPSPVRLQASPWGAGLGLVGLVLTRWEPTAATLHYTPNRWLVLVGWPPWFPRACCTDSGDRGRSAKLESTARRWCWRSGFPNDWPRAGPWSATTPPMLSESGAASSRGRTARYASC